MRFDRYYALSMAIFALLALIVNWHTVILDGHHSYIDWTPRIDLTSFKEYFLSIFKADQFMDLDNIKRIVIDWIFLLVDYELFDKIRFAAVSLLILGISYTVFLGIMERERYGIGDAKRHAIAFTAAFLYAFNPLAIEHHIAFYPQLSYALFPLAFYLLYMSLRSDRPRYPILFGALSCFLTLIVIHNALHLGLMTCCTASIALARGRIRPWEALRKALMALGVFTCLSAFVILPVAYISMGGGIPTPGYINNLGYVMLVNKNAQMLNILLLDIDLHYWPLHWEGYDYPLDGAYYITMALILSAAVIASIRSRRDLALAAALNYAALSLLANGINSPLGEIYRKAIFGFSLGWLLRASPKFTFLLPFMFSLLLIHLLVRAASLRKAAFAALLVLILLHQAIFSWPAWTGHMEGKLIKSMPNEEAMSIIGLLKEDDGEYGKVAWYGDYAESSPRETIQMLRAGRYLIDNSDPATTISQMSRALEIEYIVIDRRPTDEFVNYDYAGKALPHLERSYDPVYEGNRFTLLEVNDDVERFYVPKAVFLSYTGYDIVQAVSSQADIGRDVALIIADSAPDVSSAAYGYTDAVVFDSGYVPQVRLDSGRVIALASEVGKTPDTMDWNESEVSAGAWDGDWLRKLERIGLASDKDDYGQGLAYNSAILLEKEEGYGPLISISELGFMSGQGNLSHDGLQMTEMGRNKLLLINGTDIRDVEGLLVSGRMNSTATSGDFIFVDFYDIEGGYIKSVDIDTDEEGKMLAQLLVPMGAGHFDMRAYTHGEREENGFVLQDLRIERMAIDNAFGKDFSVGSAGEYELYLRLYKSPRGGILEVMVGNVSRRIATRSSVSGFDWVKAYGGRLEQGTSTLTIENRAGFNAVNIAYLMPAQESDDGLDGKGIIYFFQGEEDFMAEGRRMIADDSFSGRLALYMERERSVNASLHIYDERIYQVGWKGSGIDIMIDGKGVPEEGILLGEGTHTLEARAYSDKAYLDYVIITDSIAEGILGGLRDGSLEERGSVSYERDGPTSYTVKADMEGPGLLVFTSGYSRHFEADVEGDRIRPLPVYSMVNGFPIDREGQLEMKVYNGPQGWLEIGLVISALSGICITAFLVARWDDG